MPQSLLQIFLKFGRNFTTTRLLLFLTVLLKGFGQEKEVRKFALENSSKNLASAINL